VNSTGAVLETIIFIKLQMSIGKTFNLITYSIWPKAMIDLQVVTLIGLQPLKGQLPKIIRTFAIRPGKKKINHHILLEASSASYQVW